MRTNVLKEEKLKVEPDACIHEKEHEIPPHLLNESETDYGEIDPRDSPDYLTPGQLERLRESLRQLDEGQGIPHEEVVKMARSWLKR